MEELIEKKRFRLSPLFSFFIAMTSIYFIIYLFLRINNDIVHVIYENENLEQHEVLTNMPTGHELYLTTLIREKNSDNVDNELQKKINFHQRKKKYLDIIFYPIIQFEKMCWGLF